MVFPHGGVTDRRLIWVGANREAIKPVLNAMLAGCSQTRRISRERPPENFKFALVSLCNHRGFKCSESPFGEYIIAGSCVSML